MEERLWIERTEFAHTLERCPKMTRSKLSIDHGDWNSVRRGTQSHDARTFRVSGCRSYPASRRLRGDSGYSGYVARRVRDDRVFSCAAGLRPTGGRVPSLPGVLC